MDIQRMVLILIFGMSAVFLWNEWNKFTHPQLATPVTSSQVPLATPGASTPPGASAGARA